jgi:hypothetical protein
MLAAIAATGCGKAAPAEAPIGRVVELQDGDHVHVLGKAVPFPDVTPKLQLPLVGAATYDIDLEIPNEHGQRDLTRARGYLSATCSHCALGDDKTNLVSRQSQMVGTLEFGHLAIDQADVRIDVADGHAKVTRWDVTSSDFVIRVSADVKLERKLDDSSLTACVRFQPTEALHKRDPKTYVVLEITGASQGADGLFSIRLVDRLSDLKFLAQDCDTGPSP